VGKIKPTSNSFLEGKQEDRKSKSEAVVLVRGWQLQEGGFMGYGICYV